MSINLKKYEKHMLDKWQEFVNDMTENQWILFGFLGQTEELSHYDSGDGGLEDFVAELSDGRIMYGAIVLKKPNTDIDKIIFVLWQGKSVPTKVRTKVHIYNEEVMKFFKGYHLICNAQTEDDLSESSLQKLLSTASGINAAKGGSSKNQSPGKKRFINENKETEVKNDFVKQETPVPRATISTFQKPPIKTFTPKVDPPVSLPPQPGPNTFVAPKSKPQVPMHSQYKPPVYETPKPVEEIKPVKSEESLNKTTYDKVNPTQDIKTGSVSAARMMFNKQQEEKPQAPTIKANKSLAATKSNFSQPVNNKAPTTLSYSQSKITQPQIKKEVKQEPETFKPQTRAQELEEIKKNNNISKLKSQIGFGQPAPQDDVQPKPVPGKMSPVGKIKPDVLSKAPKVAELFGQRNSGVPQSQNTKIENKQIPKSLSAEIKVEAVYDFSAEQSNELSVKEGEILTVVTKDASDWWILRNSSGNQGSVPSSYVKIVENVAPTPKKQQDLLTIPVIALYDFQGSDQNELSFRKDEKLTIIIQEEDTWWMAKNESGKTGLVPSNYVENFVEKPKPQPAFVPVVKETPKKIVKLFDHDAIAEYDYAATNKDEICLKEGDKVKIIKRTDESWWEVENESGSRGLVPANYLKVTKAAEEQKPKEEPKSEPKTEVKAKNVAKSLQKQLSFIKPEPVSEDILFEVTGNYDFTAGNENELSFMEGQTLKVIKKQDSEWFVARNSLGKTGLIPVSYVTEKSSKATNKSTAKPEECSFEVEAQYDFKATQPDELTFKEGDVILVTSKVDESWWMGKNKQGKSGLIPTTYVKIKPQQSAQTGQYTQKSGNTEKIATALYDYMSDNAEEISFKDGETLYVIDDSDKDWWTARNKYGNQGLIPASYVELQSQTSTSTAFKAIAEKYKAIYDFQNETSKELPLTEGEIVDLIEDCKDGWCLVLNSKSKKGLVPFNYLEKY